MRKIVYLVPCIASQSPPPPRSMCSPSPVWTPLSAHSVLLLPLLMLFIPLYFIVIFVVQEKSTVNRIVSLEKLSSPPIRSKCPPQKLTLRLLFLMGGGVCHLQYYHQMEFGGAPSLFETFKLKIRLGVTSDFLSQELMGLPHSFICLVVFHLKSSLMLDYQQYMMLYAIVNNWGKSHCLAVTKNASSLITVSMSHMRVLGHSHQETPRLFSPIHLSFMQSHNVIGKN